MEKNITPKISVIVPVYNTEKYLHRCIDSILSQTFEDFELLLIDDGSTDNSGMICDEYANRDSRIKVFHKSNGGLTSARNHGLKYATGVWIAHIDGDDWIAPDMFDKLIEKAEEDNADIVFCDFYFAYSESKIIYRTYDWEKQGNDGLAHYIASVWTTVWCSIQRRSLYIDYKLQSPDGICFCEDFDLMVRLCFFSKTISKVTTPLYYYRQRESSIIHSNNLCFMSDELWVYSDIINFFKEHNVYNNYILRAMSWRALKASQDLALNKDSFEEFINYHPEKKAFIKGCPFIDIKLKIIMWLATHNIKWGAIALIRLRKIVGR